MPPVVSDPARVVTRPLLWRIGGRRAFERLAVDGARVQHHGVSARWVPAAAGHPGVPRVAFAVSRRAGGAVGRNRVRRRLRAGMRELSAADRLPPGDYLVGAGPGAASIPWDDLLHTLDEVVSRVTGRQQ